MNALAGLGAIVCLWVLATIIGTGLDLAWQWFTRRYR